MRYALTEPQKERVVCVRECIDRLHIKYQHTQNPKYQHIHLCWYYIHWILLRKKNFDGKSSLPNTIQITMLLPMTAMDSITENRNVQYAFCSIEISYGRTGGDFRHSPIKLLHITKEEKRNKKNWSLKMKWRENGAR